uniref:RYDR_ITPR domain-containing protein n=1 Tax=Macrostomum lignano TaxID=282301 RepID=A0A1I8JRY4_9PLAT
CARATRWRVVTSTQYHYSVRLPCPAQDPACSWVGWLHPVPSSCQRTTVRVCLASWVDVCLLTTTTSDVGWTSNATVYMSQRWRPAGEVRPPRSDVSKPRLSQGLTIGCFLDGSRRLARARKRASCTPQWPSKRASAARWLGFELGRGATLCRWCPGLLRRPKLAHAQLPNGCRRSACPASAGRGAACRSSGVNILKLSDLRGWSLLCEEPVQMVALKLSRRGAQLRHPRDGGAADLLQFHKGTLQLYKAICSHGNRTAAEMLTNHVRPDQFNFLTLNLYLSARSAWRTSTCSSPMHLESYVKLRSPHEERVRGSAHNDQVFSPGIDEDKFLHDFHEIPARRGGKCIRTNFSFLVNEDEAHPPALELCPAYPIQGLKDDCIQLFINAAALGGHLRDPWAAVTSTTETDLNPQAAAEGDQQPPGHGLPVSGGDLPDPVGGAPRTFPPELQADRHGDEAVLDFSLSDSTKTQLCKLFHLLCDTQLAAPPGDADRGRQVLPPAQEVPGHQELKPAISRGRQTNPRVPLPPEEQMRSLVHYNRAEYGTFLHCTSRASLKEFLQHYHSTLLSCCGVEPRRRRRPPKPGPGKSMRRPEVTRRNQATAAGGGMLNQLLIKMGRRQAQDLSSLADTPAGPQNLQELICQTIIKWRTRRPSRTSGFCGRCSACCTGSSTTPSARSSKADVSKLLQALGKVRCLIGVQVSPAEEEMLKASPHPDLIRCLSVHETVMQLMVHTLNKSKLAMEVTPAGAAPEEGGSSENMIVMCCRFLCYFCRTGGVQNQRAVFEQHLSFMVENGSMLLTKASLRGSCPLDVAYSSFMDNNELALALKEAQLERIASYLSRCGESSPTRSCWPSATRRRLGPRRGRAVPRLPALHRLVNGETVGGERRLVVRLLIRRPECLGPASARRSSGGGSGGGLLKAIQDGHRHDDILAKVIAESEREDPGQMATPETDYDLSRLPADDDEDYIDMGAARCSRSMPCFLAPDPNTTRSDSLRMRAILKSAVSMTDLEGVLSLRRVKVNFQVNEDGEEEYKDETGLPPGLLPEHKASVVLFLERIYGTEDPQTFFRLMKNCFLPDMRDATTMNVPGLAESDLALAINRYICNSCAAAAHPPRHLLQLHTDVDDSLLYVTLSTAYKLSKTSTLTKNQRDTISEFLVAITSQLNPHIFTKLLDKIVQDIRNLTAQSVVPLRMLT